MAGFSVAKSIALVSVMVFINLKVVVGQNDWQKSITGRPSVHLKQNCGAFFFMDQKLQGNMAALIDALWKVALCLTPLKIVVAIMLHRKIPEQPLVIRKSVNEPAVVSHGTSCFWVPGVLWQAILTCIAAVCIVALFGAVLKLSSPAAGSKFEVRVRPSRSRKSHKLVARNMHMHMHADSTTASSMSGESERKEKIVRRPEPVNPDPNRSAEYAKAQGSKQQFSEMLKLWTSRTCSRNTEAASIATQPEWNKVVSFG